MTKLPTMIPTKNRVLVKHTNPPSIDSPIQVVGDPLKEDLAHGEVVAVGPEVVEVAKGDKVRFNPYAGEEGEIGDDQVVWLREQEIVAKYE